MLYIFSGLPGSGKSELSMDLARRTRAQHLRIDIIEQALRASGVTDVGPMGYVVAYSLALHNLRLGLDVVADSVNPLEVTRTSWNQVAIDAGSPFLNIEIKCSDVAEHRRRVESRPSQIPGLELPTWQSVVEREYHGWTFERIVIDTANKAPEESKADLKAALAALGH